MNNDALIEILDRLEMRDLWNLDTMRYSVTLDEAALACVGITPLNNEGEEDQVITYGELLNSWLQITIDNVNEVPLDEFEDNLVTLKKDILKVREIYIDMREDLKEKNPTLEIDGFKTTEKSRPYVTRTSVHTWAAKHLQKNLMGWQIKQVDSLTKNLELVDVKPIRELPIASVKNQTLVIGALAQLWLTAVGAPAGIAKGDKQPNVSGMGGKIEALLKSFEITTLTSNTIRQVISPCIKALNEANGISSQAFIECVKKGLQQIEEDAPAKI
jgi:hypothetical protein